MDSLAAWYEQRPGRAGTLAQREQRVAAFWAGAERLLISHYPARTTMRTDEDDPTILARAIDWLRRAALMPGLNLPCFTPDFKVAGGVLHWGGRARWDDLGENSIVDPVARSVEEALAITPRPVDDPTMIASRAVRLWRQLADRLGTGRLWLRMSDFQGPFNTAAQIMDQQELLMAAVLEPHKVAALLDKVTTFLIDYARYHFEQTGSRVAGYTWPFTVFPPSVGLAFTEDMMPLLSAELYRDLALPCLRRLARTFGGLQIHCCGDWGRHVPALAELGPAVKAVEFHYPHTTVEQLAPLAGHAVLIPYLNREMQSRFASAVEYYEYLLRQTDARHRYWFVLSWEDEAFSDFARRHGF